MPIWNRLTAAISGLAIGGAGSAAIEPVLEVPRQKAWAAEPNRILDLGALARLVAQGLVTESSAEAEAKRNGFSAGRLKARVQLELVAAPVNELLELWRRGKITEPLVNHGLAKAQIEAQYWPALKELENARLDPEVIAAAVQRGIMPNVRDPAGGGPLLPVGPPSAVGRVTPMPQVDLDTLAEAKASGYNFERLAALARLQGNPVGPQEAARALFRGIIDEPDFERAIAEGRTRNEWAFVYREVARAIVTPIEYVNARLRGWIDTAAMHAGAARSGMSSADTDLLELIQGRPISFHQVFIGLRRGGTYDGPIDELDPAFLKSLRESDIRPEWYNLAWAQRNNLPSAFVLRQLTSSGDITVEDANTILLWSGWPDWLASKASAAWAPATSSSGPPPLVKSQTTAAVTALRKAYVGGEYDRATAGSFLAGLDHSQAEQDAIFVIWDIMKGIAGTPIDTTGGTPH